MKSFPLENHYHGRHNVLETLLRGHRIHQDLHDHRNLEEEIDSREEVTLETHQEEMIDHSNSLLSGEIHISLGEADHNTEEENLDIVLSNVNETTFSSPREFLVGQSEPNF